MIDIDSQIQPEPEPEGYEFRYYTFDELPNLEVSNIESNFNSITDTETEDTSGNNFQRIPISEDILHKLQQEDAFCKNILNQIERGNITDGQLYIVTDRILKRYIIEGDNTYETILYQEPSLYKFLEWLMMRWDIMEPIELIPYLRASIIQKD